MELLDPAASTKECEQLYEESLWCLYALQDDVMQKNNPYHDEDKKTIAMCKSQFLTLIFARFIS